MARTARQSRPQLVCVLADDSGSMCGEKAAAATAGIRELLVNCQLRGPRGKQRSYYKLLLIKFAGEASIQCDMRPVRGINPESLSLDGALPGTSIATALELAHERLEPYMESLRDHAEREEHPMPLVLVFSDGHDCGADSRPVAERIRSLNIDGNPVIVATAGVSMGADKCDEALLQDLASSPACYVPVDNAMALTEFLATVGSCGASSIVDVEYSISRLQHSPRIAHSGSQALPAPGSVARAEDRGGDRHDHND